MDQFLVLKFQNRVFQEEIMRVCIETIDRSINYWNKTFVNKGLYCLF